MNGIQCGIIGAGWWGTAAHVPALKAHPSAELVAVQSNDAVSLKRIAKDFAIPYACATVEELLATPNLQAVVVSSIPNAHYRQAKAALELGLHVLIEKPMTLSAAEAEDLVLLSEKRGVQFLVSCPWHYTSHAVEARKLLHTGKLGSVRMISVLMTNFLLGLYQGRPWSEVFADSPTIQNAAKPYLEPGRTTYSDPLIAGGGQIHCQVSHVAAYIGFLTGRQPAEVFARFDNAGTQVDVHDVLSIQLDDGTLVSIATTGATMLSARNYEVRIYGSDGMILLELWKGTMEHHDRTGGVTIYPALPESDVYPMFAPTRNFIDAITGDSPNGSPATLGLFAMKVIGAAVESARSGRNIRVAGGNARMP